MFIPDALTLIEDRPYGVIPWRNDVATVFPDAPRKTFRGSDVLVLAHTPDVCRVLRNLGVSVEAPILRRYDWAGLTPYASQRATAALLTTNAAAYVLNDYGTGKTRSSLFAFDHLREHSPGLRMLVVAPLSTVEDTWVREVERVFPHLRAKALVGTKERRLKALGDPHVDVFIINHDGVVVIAEALPKVAFGVVCIDELTAFKNTSTTRWKVMNAIIATAKWRWGLTGSPVPQGPEDAHGQIRLITPDNAPVSKKRWQARVSMQVSNFRWLPRAEANDIVFDAMTPAVRFRRDDVVELPPCVVLRRPAPMSKTQKEVYHKVMTKLRAEVSDGEITAANEGVKLTKLLQIASGFAYTEGSTVKLDPKPRIDAVIEILEQTTGKALIFSPFVAGVQMLSAALAVAGHRVQTIDGSTPSGERKDIFARFRNEPDERAIVAHPKTMSHGLNLQEANIVIWAAPYPSLEIYEQANARVKRPGQKKKQAIIQLVGCAVEAQIYNRLDKRASMQNALLEMFE